MEEERKRKNRKERVRGEPTPHPSSCWFYTRGLRGVGGGRLWDFFLKAVVIMKALGSMEG